MTTWISWEHHRRSKEICAYLGIENKVFASKRSRLLRHPLAVTKTMGYLFQHRPQTLIVQCPSVFLALLACFLKPLLGYTLLVDAHSDALTPDKPILQRFYFLYAWIHRKADVVVVTNDNVVHIVEKHGGRAFVLPDRLFEPPVLGSKPLRSKHNIAFVCSFDVDEPYAEVFEAFRDARDTTLYVTGRAPQEVLEKYQDYKNIVFTGFTPLKDYLTLLRSVDGILALTTRENSTLCAANEAVSFAKPMIISNSAYLRSYFAKGTIYTANTTTAIREAYETFLRDYDRLQTEMTAFKPQLSRAWEEQGKKFKALVHSSASELKEHLPATQ
jgi:glycosyltransferase involved in cell wall biosynthesis